MIPLASPRDSPASIPGVQMATRRRRCNLRELRRVYALSRKKSWERVPERASITERERERKRDETLSVL